MKKLNLKFSVFIILFGILAGCAQDNKDGDLEADITAIKQHYDQYLLAVNTNDLVLFMSLWADDATRMAPGGPAFVGIEEIRAHFKSIFDPFKLRMVYIGETEVGVSGDQAYAYGTVTLSTIPKEGGPVNQTDIKWLDILKRQADGSWKIFIDCVNLHPSLGSELNPADLLENQKQSSPY